MKKTLLALTAATALAASAPAHAFTPGGAFTLTGPATFVFGVLPPITCTVRLTVNSVTNQITSAGFTGPAFCSSIVAVGMSWTTVQNPIIPNFIIQGMSLSTPAASCPATNVVGAWSNASPGTMTIPLTNMSTTCRIVTATLSASPAQTLP